MQLHELRRVLVEVLANMLRTPSRKSPYVIVEQPFTNVRLQFCGSMSEPLTVEFPVSLLNDQARRDFCGEEVIDGDVLRVSSVPPERAAHRAEQFLLALGLPRRALVRITEEQISPQE